MPGNRFVSFVRARCLVARWNSSSNDTGVFSLFPFGPPSFPFSRVTRDRHAGIIMFGPTSARYCCCTSAARSLPTQTTDRQAWIQPLSLSHLSPRKLSPSQLSQSQLQLQHWHQLHFSNCISCSCISQSEQLHQQLAQARQKLQ